MLFLFSQVSSRLQRAARALNRGESWRQNLLQYFLSTTSRKADVIRTERHSMKTGLASLHK